MKQFTMTLGILSLGIFTVLSNPGWAASTDPWADESPHTTRSVSFKVPKSKGTIYCARSPEQLYKCEVSGTSKGVKPGKYVLLLWVKPVNPSSETPGWYLQRGENGVSGTGTGGAWKGLIQLGNREYPPHEGDTLDLAVTVTDFHKAEELKSKSGVVVLDEPDGEISASENSITVTLKK